MENEKDIGFPEEGPPTVDERIQDEDVFDPLKYKKPSKKKAITDVDHENVPEISDWDEEEFEEIEEVEEWED
jgi:hypothetical protein